MVRPASLLRSISILALVTASLACTVNPSARGPEPFTLDNVPGPGRTVASEPGDRWISLGTISMGPGTTGRTREVTELRDFEVDLVVVTFLGEAPSDGGVLFDGLEAFQLSTGRTEDPVEVLAGGAWHPELIVGLEKIIRDLEISCPDPKRGQVARLSRGIEATSALLVE